MRKSLKIPLYIILALVLVFLVIISIIPWIFDPNAYKFEITEAVRRNTGRVLEIEGDLKLQVLPKLAVTTGKMRLNNPEGFSRQTFAEFDSGFFRIRLIPLLSKQIDIKKIVLNGLKVHLIRTKDGRMNWKRFRGSSRTSGNRPIPLRYKNLQAGRAVLADSPLAMLFALKIDIFDAEVNYDDQITGIKINVQDLEFIIDRFGFGRGIDFRIQGNLTNSKPLFHQSETISGRIFLNEKLDNFKVEDFVWSSRFDGDVIPADFRQTELTATAEINLAKHTFSATGVRLTSGHTSLGANLSASRIFEKPTLDGQVSIEQANPGKLIEFMGIENTGKNPTTLQTLSGNFGLALNESRLLFKDIALVLDANPIRGVASIAGLESPKIKFNLSAERLDADRYLSEWDALSILSKPESPPGNSTVEGEASALIDNNKPIEFNGATVQGILNFESLRYRGLLAEGVQMAFELSNGVVRSNQRFKKFYGGRLKGSVEFNNREREPVLALNQNLSGVRIGPLLRDLNGKQPIEGSLDATIRLVGHGAQPQDFKSSLNGEIDATLTDGQVHGVDLEKVIKESRGLIPESGMNAASKAGRTKFSKLIYKATVIAGVVDNALIEANSAHFDFNGSGKIFLADDKVDYRIDAVINDNPDGIAGIEIEKLQGLRIPIQIGGSLSALTFRTDFKGTLKDPKVKAAAKKLKGKLGSGTRGIPNNLF